MIGGGDWNKSRLIPDMVNSFQNKKKFIVRNFDHTRPWQHVYDVLNAYMKIVKKIHKKKSYYDNFNVSFHTNNQKTVREIINIIKMNEFFKHIKISSEKTKKYKEDKFLNISNNKMKKFINIKSKFKNIEDSIENVLDWYKAYVKSVNKIDDYSKKEILKFFN